MPAGPLSKQVSGLILKVCGYIYNDLSKQPGSGAIGIKPELLVVRQAHVILHLPPKHSSLIPTTYLMQFNPKPPSLPFGYEIIICFGFEKKGERKCLAFFSCFDFLRAEMTRSVFIRMEKSLFCCHSNFTL